MLWIVALLQAPLALAGGVSGLQGEVQVGFVRTNYVYDLDTDAPDNLAAAGIGFGTTAHWSLVSLMRGGAEGLVIADWWGGDIGIGSHLGRNASLWYELDFDFGLRVGVHESDFDAYVTPFIRTGNFRGHESMGLGNQGVPNAGIGTLVTLRSGPAIVEGKFTFRTGSEGFLASERGGQTSLAFGVATDGPQRHLVRWERTAQPSGDTRKSQGTLMYVFRMGG